MEIGAAHQLRHDEERDRAGVDPVQHPAHVEVEVGVDVVADERVGGRPARSPPRSSSAGSCGSAGFGSSDQSSRVKGPLVTMFSGRVQRSPCAAIGPCAAPAAACSRSRDRGSRRRASAGVTTKVESSSARNPKWAGIGEFPAVVLARSRHRIEQGGVAGGGGRRQHPLPGVDEVARGDRAAVAPERGAQMEGIGDARRRSRPRRGRCRGAMRRSAS